MCVSLHTCAGECMTWTASRLRWSPPAVSGSSPWHTAINLLSNSLFFHFYLPRCVSVRVCECHGVTITVLRTTPVLRWWISKSRWRKEKGFPANLRSGTSSSVPFLTFSFNPQNLTGTSVWKNCDNWLLNSCNFNHPKVMSLNVLFHLTKRDAVYV